MVDNLSGLNNFIDVREERNPWIHKPARSIAGIKKCGIYKITCSPNKKVYIGSSIDIDIRFYKHKSLLKNNKHVNKNLQNSYNKYGINNFKFEILELTLWKDLIKKEQYWFDYFKNEGFDMFNYNNFVESPHKGKRMLDHTRKKLSESHRLNPNKYWQGKHLPEEMKEKIRIANTGKTASKEKIIKMSKWHIFINPKGEKIKIFNLVEFCKTNNLDHRSMYKVKQEIRNHHKGWTKYNG